MIKRLNFGLLIILAMVLVVSCAPKPVSVPPTPPTPPALAEVETTPEEPPTTGEASIDEIAADISDAENIDEELDTSELDDVESILADIENI